MYPVAWHRNSAKQTVQRNAGLSMWQFMCFVMLCRILKSSLQIPQRKLARFSCFWVRWRSSLDSLQSVGKTMNKDPNAPCHLEKQQPFESTHYVLTTKIPLDSSRTCRVVFLRAPSPCEPLVRCHFCKRLCTACISESHSSPDACTCALWTAHVCRW